MRNEQESQEITEQTSEKNRGLRVFCISYSLESWWEIYLTAIQNLNGKNSIWRVYRLHMVCAIFQNIDRNNPSRWVYDPVLPDACSLVQVEPCEAVNSMSGVGADCSHPLRSGVPGGAVRPSQRGICCHPQAAGPPCGSLRAVCLPVEVHEGGFPGTLILQWNPTVPFLPARRMADGSPSWRWFAAVTVYR